MRGNCIPLVLQPVASVLRCISFAAWRALLRAKMGRSSELRAPLAVPCWVMDLPLNQTSVAPHTSSHAGGTLSIEQSFILAGDIVDIMHWYDGGLCTEIVYKGKRSLGALYSILSSRSEPWHLLSRLFEEVRCFDPGGRSPWCGVTLTSLVAGGIWGLLLPTRHLSINDHFLSRPRVLGLSLDLRGMASCLIYFELWEGQGLNNDTTKCNSMS